MIKIGEVLDLIAPNCKVMGTGNKFEDIVFLEGNPPTKEQFDIGFAQLIALKAQQEADKAAEKQAILDKLGITAEQAKLLLS